MADDPTIEEVAAAKARLAAVLAERDTLPVDSDDDGAPHILVPLAEFRTLLASHASLEERVKEAKTLAESALAMLRHTHDRLLSAYPEFDTLCISLNTEALALAAFVNEKERT